MLVDTHFHLDLMENMQLLIKQVKDANIGIIAVGTTPLAYRQEIKFINENRNFIKVGLGLHPQLVEQRSQEIDLFLQLSQEAKYIGEVGLDFNKDYGKSKMMQIDCFREIARKCAIEGEKVLSIHSVKASKVAIEILQEEKVFNNCKCIFHWFTGSVSERKLAISNGAYFSINPKMLQTKGGKDLICNIPEDRILLETDAPFTMKCNSVEDLDKELNRIARGICSIRNEDVISQIEDNSMRIFENNQ
ncbi:TatD DNase family protein [Hathewaya proteolytica DSM 3090]|uniref:TatD DNase family protein n=1 Tax=Hathewaya proteolytica DSM 3090 TaxID=1121331 RepID=A0A1M6KFP3_9CLOT|nr:Qat anti-phage system TatD family nuclease QatD [Hathewaya proteolytica]SHJ57825.1 TatD DNase family protein [Hathewaya proteolytica DSM 3090]